MSIRLSDLKLPLDHAADALPQAICARLGIDRAALKGWQVFRRGNDARRRNAIQLVYTVDLELADEAPREEVAERGERAVPSARAEEVRVARVEAQVEDAAFLGAHDGTVAAVGAAGRDAGSDASRARVSRGSTFARNASTSTGPFLDAAPSACPAR